MMGPRQEAQPALFYEFSLADHVPQDHLLRSIDRFVDLGSVRGHLADFYSHTGRPSIDPELLIRMLLVGYCFGITSHSDPASQWTAARKGPAFFSYSDNYLPEHYYAKPEPVIDPAARIDHAEAFFAATGADIRHGGNSAHYTSGTDHVQMPVFESFRSPEAYYATLAHELTHWTKHKDRLDRDFGRKAFGDEGYAREELVAELGAAFLCADLALTPEPGEDHAAYIQHWLKVLKDDKRAIFSAAAHAQRAADYLHGLQTNTEQGKEGVAA